jgi:branched-chain amino acid transport system permease protein
LRIGVTAVVVGGTIGTLIKGRYEAAQWFDLVMFGLTLGSVYALIALGYTMVYGVLRLINFAHGDIMMTGAFSGYFVASSLDYSGFLNSNPVLGMGAVLAVAIATSVTIAVLTERFAYRPFRHVRGFAPLICAIGVSFFLEQTFRGFFGPSIRSYPDPKWQAAAVEIFGLSIPRVDILVISLAVVAMLILYLIVQKTRMGTAMRAVSEDTDAAAMMGIDVNRTISVTFVIAGALAGAGGLVFALYRGGEIRYDTGYQLGLIAFTSAVLGGIGNLPGAVLGALVIGFIQAFNEGLQWHAPGSDWTESIVFGILILILVFRPEGLLGERTPEGG